MLSKQRKLYHITSNSETAEEISHITSNSETAEGGISHITSNSETAGEISHITSYSETAEGGISHITSNSDAVERKIQFLDLPPLILYKILGYISEQELVKNVSVVCKSLREMSLDPVLLRTYTLEYVSLNVMTQHLMRMPLLQNLEIRGLNWRSDEYIPVIRKLCPKITSITVHEVCDIEVLKNISHYFPNLETLRIISFEIKEAHATAKIVSSLKRLRELTLTLLDKCDQCGYNCVIEQVQNLEIFESARGLSNRDVFTLVKNSGRTLKNLWLWDSLDDCSCMKLAECKELQELSFIEANNISDKGLAALSNLPKLNLLEMTAGKLITSRGLQRFIESGNLRNLEYLSLCDFLLDDDVVKAICNNCKYMKGLSLSGMVESETDVESVTDEAVHAIVNNLRYLEKLSFGFMGNITGRGLDKIPEKLPELTILYLYGCKSIDMQVMRNLENSYSRLEVVYGTGRKDI